MNDDTGPCNADEPVWRYEHEGVFEGPHSETELTRLAAKQAIGPDTELFHRNGRRVTARELISFKPQQLPDSAAPSTEDELVSVDPGSHWYYEQNGEQIGPFSYADLQRLLDGGLITSETTLLDTGKRAPTAADLGLVKQPQLTQETGDLTGASVKALPANAQASPPSTREAVLIWLAVLPLLLAFLMPVASAITETSLPTWPIHVIGLLASPIWLFIAGRAVLTGVIFGFTGRRHRRPVLYRIAGFGLAYVGLGLAFVATISEPGSLQDNRGSSLADSGQVSSEEQASATAAAIELAAIVDYNNFIKQAQPLLVELDAIQADVENNIMPGGRSSATKRSSELKKAEERAAEIARALQQIPAELPELQQMRDMLSAMAEKRTLAVESLARGMKTGDHEPLQQSVDYVQQSRQHFSDFLASREEFANAYNLAFEEEQ